MRDLFVGSIFIPFVPSQSIEAYNRASRAIRKTRHPHLPMLAGCVARLYRSSVQGCRFLHPFLFDIPLFLLKHSRRKNIQGSKKVREKEKQIRNSLNLGSGFGNTLWDVTTHLSLSFSSPMQYNSFMVSFTVHDKNDCLNCAFLKKKNT